MHIQAKGLAWILQEGYRDHHTAQPHFSGSSKPQLIESNPVQKLNWPLNSYWHKRPARHSPAWACTNSKTNHFWAEKHKTKEALHNQEVYRKGILSRSTRSESGTETDKEAPPPLTPFPHPSRYSPTLWTDTILTHHSVPCVVGAAKTDLSTG